MPPRTMETPPSCCGKKTGLKIVPMLPVTPPPPTLTLSTYSMSLGSILVGIRHGSRTAEACQFRSFLNRQINPKHLLGPLRNAAFSRHACSSFHPYRLIFESTSFDFYSLHLSNIRCFRSYKL